MRASETKRAANVRDLVKNGREKARIAVYIKNEGVNAMDPERFGKYIIVERHISRSEQGKYIVKNQQKVVVEKSKELVDRILSHFNIQVDNPCVVLNQEAAREFLKSNNPKDRYNYFLKATLLHSISEKLAEIAARKTELKKELAIRKEMLEDQESRYKKAKDDMDAAEELKNIDEKIEKCQASLVLVLLEEKKEELRKKMLKKERVVNKRKELQEKISYSQQVVQQIEQEKAAFSTKEQQIPHDLDTCIESLRAKTRLLVNLKEEIRRLEKDQKKALENIQRADKEQIRIRTNLEKSRQHHLSSRKESDTIKRKVDEIFERLAFAEEDMKSNASIVDKLKLEEHERSESLREKSQSLEGLERELTSIDGALQGIGNARRDRKLVFGNYANDVEKEIFQQRSQFREMPLGPLGMYISLNDENYQVPIEACIGRTFLCGYVVDNYSDLHRLKAILMRYYKGNFIPVVFVQKKPSGGNYQIGNPPPFIAQKGIPNVLSLISIKDSNPWVFNLLIDQVKVERNFIVETAVHARQFLQELQIRCQDSRRFVNNVYDATGSNTSERDGSITKFAVWSSSDRKYLSSDFNQQETQLRHRRESLSSQVLEVRKELEHEKEKLNSLRSDLKSASENHSKSYNDVRALRSQHRSRKEEFEQCLQDSEEFDDSPFLEEIKIYEQRKVDAQREYESIAKVLNEKQGSLKIVYEEKEELERRKLSLREALNSFESRLREFVERIEKEKTLQLTLENLRGSLLERLNQLESVIQEIEEAKSNLSRTAVRSEDQEISSDFQNLSAAELRAKIVEFSQKKQIEEMRLNANFDEILERFEKLEVEFSQAKVKYLNSTNNLNENEVLYLRSHAFWLKLRSRLSRKVAVNFAENLECQNYSGGLNFDHQNGKLELEFHRRNDGSSSNDARTLSGGERSFSTLCFVVGISEVVMTPFVAMDEFDIFMDPVNRKLSTDLLLDLATNRKNRQFIFITPHDVSMVQQSECVKVFKLKPPERNSN